MAREPDPTPELTPGQEQHVRRLLADARHTDPMPVDVAARLDRVLADLGTGAAPAPVVPLAARRRRRAVTMLVAAAAVVAAGVGLAQLVHPGGPGSSSNSSATSSDVGDSGGDVSRGPDSSRRSVAGESASGPSTGGASSGGAGAPGSPDRATGGAQGSPITVRPGHFARDVTRARGLVASTAANGAAPGDGAAAPGVRCPAGDWGRGRPVAVRYGDRIAVLVLRPVRGDTQVVDLFRCGGSEVLRSITLPAP